MTFLTLTPWLHRNAYDEDGRVLYEEFISARFIRPVEEAVRGALKNADWDPLPPKAGKGKKASTVLPRPSTPVAAVSRTTAPPMAGAAVVTSTATPPSHGDGCGGGAKDPLAHRTMPSTAPLPARPSTAVAPSRKRSREVAATGTPREAEVAEATADASEGTQAAEAKTEAAVVELPRKRILLILSEGEDEEEAPPATGTMTNAEAEVVAAEVPISEAEGAEASIAEVKGAEASIAEAEGAEEERAEASIAEAATVDPPLETLVESPLLVEAVASLAVTALIEPPSVAPHRPGGIVFRSVGVSFLVIPSLLILDP
ncbi:uncharacterized protein Pyn_05108 [Prunus yedoensis var. nudiflora]|uniref:Uncharacterized protein n=1 Tax=Prunus yedoensis var. nudiflora TaxID=2094558 RepID=A0A314Z6I5_PRUYE|nr:uncharacterized protein Pyn_05108 [Prunus yedoensis var. nudiflora]